MHTRSNNYQAPYQFLFQKKTTVKNMAAASSLQLRKLLCNSSSIASAGAANTV